MATARSAVHRPHTVPYCLFVSGFMGPSSRPAMRIRIITIITGFLRLNPAASPRVETHLKSHRCYVQSISPSRIYRLEVVDGWHQRPNRDPTSIPFSVSPAIFTKMEHTAAFIGRLLDVIDEDIVPKTSAAVQVSSLPPRRAEHTPHSVMAESKHGSCVRDISRICFAGGQQALRCRHHSEEGPISGWEPI